MVEVDLDRIRKEERERILDIVYEAIRDQPYSQRNRMSLLRIVDNVRAGMTAEQAIKKADWGFRP